MRLTVCPRLRAHGNYAACVCACVQVLEKKKNKKKHIGQFTATMQYFFFLPQMAPLHIDRLPENHIPPVLCLRTLNDVKSPVTYSIRADVEAEERTAETSCQTFQGLLGAGEIMKPVMR